MTIVINAAPSFNSLGLLPRSITTGFGDLLDCINVGDPDADQNLILSLLPSGGTTKGLADADVSTPGIQIGGSAAAINAALAAAS